MSCTATKDHQLFSLGFEKLEFLGNKFLEGQDYSVGLFVASVPFQCLVPRICSVLTP